MTIYTSVAKREQLERFIRKVRLLCEHLTNCGEFSDSIKEFRIYEKEAEDLLREGFTQADLKELSYSVMPIIGLHRDWIPPLEETDSGFSVPDYYPKLQKLHKEVMDAAFELKVLGKY